MNRFDVPDSSASGTRATGGKPRPVFLRPLSANMQPRRGSIGWWQFLAIIWFITAMTTSAIAYQEWKAKKRFQESYDYLLDHPELSAKTKP